LREIGTAEGMDAKRRGLISPSVKTALEGCADVKRQQDDVKYRRHDSGPTDRAP